MSGAHAPCAASSGREGSCRGKDWPSTKCQCSVLNLEAAMPSSVRRMLRTCADRQVGRWVGAEAHERVTTARMHVHTGVHRASTVRGPSG